LYREGFTPCQRSRICLNYFQASDIVETYYCNSTQKEQQTGEKLMYRRLMEDAVSIVSDNSPSYMKINGTIRKTATRGISKQQT
jgi:hypothetical protein